MTLVRWLALVVLCVLTTSVASAQQKDAAARVAYAEGRDAYQTGKYALALEKFRLSYTLSGEPALLYNISTALQNLNRPGDAADALEQYVRARPEDPQRAELEKRIQNLRLSQSLLEKQEQHETAERERQAAVIAIAPGPGWMSDAEADRLIYNEKKRRKKLAVGLGVGLGTPAVGGIVVGVVCGLGYCKGSEPKDWDYAKNPVTQ